MHGKVKQSESVSEQRQAITNIANFKGNSGHSKLQMTVETTPVRSQHFQHWKPLMEQPQPEFHLE